MPLYKVISSEASLQPFKSIELGKKYSEQNIENWIEKNPEVVLEDEPILVIGRQVVTPVGIIDLLALDSTGSVIIIELKRTPGQREAASQAIEYASWIDSVNHNEVLRIANNYLTKNSDHSNLGEAWKMTFDSDFQVKGLNHSQRLIVVIEGSNTRLTSMVRYLRTKGFDIFLLSYNFFVTDTNEEILLVNSEVGEIESSSSDETKPSETNLINKWSQSSRDAYSVVKSMFLIEGLYLTPKLSGISFSVQTKEGSVFVCFIYMTDDELSTWIRTDSMKSRFDFDTAIVNMTNNLPPGFYHTITPQWFILKFPPSQDNAKLASELIINEVVNPLKNPTS
jgi:Holliday junction resolvase-like predicted endonuclease